MSLKNRTRHSTAFTVSIEARTGVTTGISAADRARTIAVAIALGTGGAGDSNVLVFGLQALMTTALIGGLIYLMYNSAGRISRAIGATGTVIVARLSAFLLFCIGIQVMWTGIAELVAGLQAA